jgi:hypothetical protein
MEKRKIMMKNMAKRKRNKEMKKIKEKNERK